MKVIIHCPPGAEAYYVVKRWPKLIWWKPWTWLAVKYQIKIMFSSDD